MTEQHINIDDILKYSDGVYMNIDFEWFITYANPLSKKILGISAKELVGSDFREVLPDIVSIFYKTLSSTLHHQKSHCIKALYGPSQKILELKSYPSENGVLAIFHDVTESEEYARKINDSQIRHRAILEALTDALITINGKGLITSSNKAVENLFGYKGEELIGLNVSVLLPEDERKEHEEYTAYSDLNEARIINKKRTLYALHKDGSTFPIELNVAPLSFEGYYGYLGIIRDITERKRAENNLVEKVKFEKANEIKSEFIAKMSHELRTPLNAILGYTQLLEMETDLDITYKSQVNEIHKAGYQLLNQIEDVLTYSEIDIHIKDIQYEDVSLIDALNECLNALSQLSKELNVTFNVDPNCNKCFLRTDPVRFQQVLTNIISNALKYNIENGLVSITCKRNDNNRLNITISDTGSGIDPSKLDEVFEAFNRLDKEGSAIYGTGIGLNVAKQLIEAMDGKIGVESILGKGSQFWIELPEAKIS